MPFSPSMVLNAFGNPSTQYQWENLEQGRLSLGGGGSGYGTLKQMGHTRVHGTLWDVFISAGEAG